MPSWYVPAWRAFQPAAGGTARASSVDVIVAALALGPLGDFAGWITSIVQSLGYVGVALLTALENLFPPIPSELILPLAGFLAGQGQFHLPIAIAAAVAGSTFGAAILYTLGRWLGEVRLRQLVQDHGKWLLLDEDDVDRAADWFRRHGGKAVYLGRLVPGVRSIISIPAGIEKMPIPKFALFTVLGSATWDGPLVLLGWLLGHNWSVVEKYGQFLEYGALVLFLGGTAWWIKRRWNKKGPGAEKRQTGRSRA